MKTLTYLSIAFSSTLLASLACSFSTTSAVPTNTPLNNIQIPTIEPTSPALVNGLCENKYLPIFNDTTKTYAVMTTIADSTISSTNYETLFYFDDRDDFTVQTRLRKRVGPAVDEHWNCNKRGLVKTSFEGGEFSAYFTDDYGYNTWRTADTCRGGVTLPSIINPDDTWTQQTDFEFTSSNLTGWNWLKWNIFRKSLNSQTLPLPAGSGRFIYNYKAIGIEQVIVPAGTYNAIRVDVIAEGYIDPSRDFSPTFEDTTTGQICRRNPNKVDEVNPLMSRTFAGSTWWVPEIGWVKKVGTLSNSQGVIESYEMELESFEVPQ
jgi:hypothetical protein